MTTCVTFGRHFAWEAARNGTALVTNAVETHRAKAVSHPPGGRGVQQRVQRAAGHELEEYPKVVDVGVGLVLLGEADELQFATALEW